jgi:hypothetical protein
MLLGIGAGIRATHSLTAMKHKHKHKHKYHVLAAKLRSTTLHLLLTSNA